MCDYLFSNNIKVFDFPTFTQQFSDKIRQQVEKTAVEHQVKIAYIQSRNKFNGGKYCDII